MDGGDERRDAYRGAVDVGTVGEEEVSRPEVNFRGGRHEGRAVVLGWAVAGAVCEGTVGDEELDGGHATRGDGGDEGGGCS